MTTQISGCNIPTNDLLDIALDLDNLYAECILNKIIQLNTPTCAYYLDSTHLQFTCINILLINHENLVSSIYTGLSTYAIQTLPNACNTATPSDRIIYSNSVCTEYLYPVYINQIQSIVNAVTSPKVNTPDATTTTTTTTTTSTTTTNLDATTTTDPIDIITTTTTTTIEASLISTSSNYIFTVNNTISVYNTPRASSGIVLLYNLIISYICLVLFL